MHSVHDMARIDALTKSGSTASARAQGKGPTLLVVHPGGAGESSWDAVTSNLIRDFEVVRLRRRIYLPGADLTSHSMAVEVADILAIAAVLEPPILLVGQASGAVAAFEAALSIPWEFAGLVAYEPLMLTRSSPAGPAQTVSQNPAQQADSAAVEALGIGIDRYAGLALPITLVEGELSPAPLREGVADLAAVLPHAQVITLPGQGHEAHLQAADQLAEVIRGVAHPLLR
jgi:pimeloyl-ACP methyl ester carboxylesterase